MAKKLLAILAQLLVPGAGFAALGSHKLAALNALFLLTFGWALCQVTTWGPSYFVSGLILGALFHIFCLIQVNKKSISSSLQWKPLVLYVVVFILIWSITQPTSRVRAFESGSKNPHTDFSWMKESFLADMKPTQYFMNDIVLTYEEQSLKIRKLIELKENSAVVASFNNPAITKEISFSELKGRKLYIWFSKDLSRLFKNFP